MDAVKFFKTVNMLCKNQSCEECPVYKNDIHNKITTYSEDE